MDLFVFTEEDYRKILNGPHENLFRSAVALAVNCSLPGPSDWKTWIRIDLSELKGINIIKEGIPGIHDLLSNGGKSFPLPLITLCEDLDSIPDLCVYKSWVQQDHRDRETLLKLATDEYQPAWWVYYHNCEAQAIFITYTMCKILFPGKFYVLDLPGHRAVINEKAKEVLEKDKKVEIQGRSTDSDKPLVFDPIMQIFDLDFYKGDQFTIIDDRISYYMDHYGHSEVVVQDLRDIFDKIDDLREN